MGAPTSMVKPYAIETITVPAAEMTSAASCKCACIFVWANSVTISSWLHAHMATLTMGRQHDKESATAVFKNRKVRPPQVARTPTHE